jgi:hypothetical protein
MVDCRSMPWAACPEGAPVGGDSSAADVDCKASTSATTAARAVERREPLDEFGEFGVRVIHCRLRHYPLFSLYSMMDRGLSGQAGPVLVGL